MSTERVRALLREHGIGTPAGAPQGGGAQPDIGRTVREILYQEFAALAEELVRTQVYVASRTRGSSISRVYLNGSVARYRHIGERIGELVRLPVGGQLCEHYLFSDAALLATLREQLAAHEQLVS